MQVNNVDMALHVDSLADRSVLDLSTFNKYFVDEAIEPAGPDDVLKSYTCLFVFVVFLLQSHFQHKSDLPVDE